MISHIDIPFPKYTSIIQTIGTFSKVRFKREITKFRPIVSAISRLSSRISCAGIAHGRSKLVITLLKLTFEKVPIPLTNRHIFM